MPSFTDLIDTVDVPVLLADATDEILRASGVSPDESRAHIERIGRRRFQHSLPERVPAATIAMTPSAIAAIKVARQMRCHRAEAGGPDEEIEALAADIAHDLKEPLRTVSMYTQLLARKVVLDAEGKELAESVAAGVARIGALLDGLQIFAVRGFAGAPQPVDLNDVVANALHNLGHAIAISATVVTVGLLPRVRSNAQLLERVLQNLIANAIKYRSQAPALIHVSASRLGPDWVLRVEDNGVGIAPAYHEKIFELLKRLHGPEIPGSGIGLATCRKIVEGLGGVIWVESEEQLGSAFCFTISANDGDEHKSLVAPERPSANTPIQLVKRASNRPQPIPETI